jgi:hypothetical protein
MQMAQQDPSLVDMLELLEPLAGEKCLLVWDLEEEVEYRDLRGGSFVYCCRVEEEEISW